MRPGLGLGPPPLRLLFGGTSAALLRLLALASLAGRRGLALGALCLCSRPRLALGPVAIGCLPSRALRLRNRAQLGFLQFPIGGLEAGTPGVAALLLLGLEPGPLLSLPSLGLLGPGQLALVLALGFVCGRASRCVLRLGSLPLLALASPPASLGAAVVEADLLSGVEGVRPQLDVRRSLAGCAPQIPGLDPGIEGVGIGLGGRLDCARTVLRSRLHRSCGAR
jgi:hypothetical protein